MFVCMRQQGLDHTHHCVFFNSLLLPRPQVPLQWDRSDDPGTPSPLVYACPSSVDTSGDKLVLCGWLCSTTGPLWSLSHEAKLQISHFQAGILLKAVHVRLLSTKWAKSQFKSQWVPRLRREHDLALQLEKAPPALLWHSPHSVQSGILRRHMLKERKWSHRQIYVYDLRWHHNWKHAFVSVKSAER